MAGIIPVEVQPMDFKMPWNDALMPIAANYLAVERAVYECAFAGCETIWMICSRETIPLIRERIGDWILDPIYNMKTLQETWNPSERFKQIPIFYVPIHPKDKIKRTGIAWAIMYGFDRAYRISTMFSRWTTPSKYYVAFPWGVYQPNQLHDYRRIISDPTSIFLQSKDGKTAKDGEMLAFTFDAKDFKLFVKHFREEEQMLWKDESNSLADAKSKFIKVPTILQSMKITDKNTIPIEWSYDISSWEKYCQFLGSIHHGRIKRPGKSIKPNRFNPIGEDSESYTEEEEPVETFDDAG